MYNIVCSYGEEIYYSLRRISIDSKKSLVFRAVMDCLFECSGSIREGGFFLGKRLK